MFSLWCIDRVGSLYANQIFVSSVSRLASGPSMTLIVALPGLFSYLSSYKSASNPALVYSTDRSKAVVPVLVLVFVALWFILRGNLIYVLPCVILFLCFSVLLALRLPRLGKRKLILVLLVRLFDLCLFGFVSFLFLLVSGKGCGLWLWHSLDFSLIFFGCFLFLLVSSRAPACDYGTPLNFLLPFLAHLTDHILSVVRPSVR